MSVPISRFAAENLRPRFCDDLFCKPQGWCHGHGELVCQAVIEKDPASVRVTYMGSHEGSTGAGTGVDVETLLVSAEKDFEKGNKDCLHDETRGGLCTRARPTKVSIEFPIPVPSAPAPNPDPARLAPLHILLQLKKAE